MISPSGSVAVAIAIVVPVAVSSEKEEAIKEVLRLIASSTSVTVKAISEVVSLVPSEAVNTKVYEEVVS
jgi:hypothetical protein